jgi:hypothetical protein
MLAAGLGAPRAGVMSCSGRVHEIFFKMFEMPGIRCESDGRHWTRFRITTEPV